MGMMRTRLVLCGCVLLGSCASALAADAEGVPGVNALLDRIENAHASRDAKMLLDESLIVRRGAQELSLVIPGSHGLGGTGMEAVLLPRAPATLVGPGAPHPIKEQIRRGLERLAEGRTDDLDATYHPDGFFMYLPRASRPTRLIGLEEIKALIRTGVEQHGKSTGAAGIGVEGVSIITDGMVELTTGSITHTDRKTGKAKSSPTRASVYVRRGEAWVMAADLGQPLRFGKSGE